MARLKGQRVVIRPLRLDDVDRAFLGRMKLADQGNLEGYPDHEQLRTQFPQWSVLRDGRVNLGIEVEGRLIGEIQTFQPTDRPPSSGRAVLEVGVSIYDAADRGRGLGTEAMALFVPWLFRQGAEQVQGRTAATNQPMRRLLERAGFVREDQGGSNDSESLRYRLSRPEA